MILQAAALCFFCTITIAYQPLPKGVINYLATTSPQTIKNLPSDVEEKVNKVGFKMKEEEGMKKEELKINEEGSREYEKSLATHDASSNLTGVAILDWLFKDKKENTDISLQIDKNTLFKDKLSKSKHSSVNLENESLPKTDEGKSPTSVSEKVKERLNTGLTSSETFKLKVGEEAQNLNSVNLKNETNTVLLGESESAGSCLLNSNGTICTCILVFSATVYLHSIYELLNQVNYF